MASVMFLDASCSFCKALVRWPGLQAMAVHSAVVKGWKEMDDMTHADTLGLAKTLDNIRAQINLVYPQDAQAGGVSGSIAAS